MKKIITVDDEVIHNKRIESILKNDFDVISFVSPKDCLQYLGGVVGDEVPIAIFLDVQMQELSGIELCKEIKKLEGLQDCPVIFVSIKDTVQDTIAGYQAGAVDYISKSIGKEALHLKLNAILATQQTLLSLGDEKASASSLAFDLMTNASEMGEIVRLVQSFENVHDFESLQQLLFEYFSSLNLTVIIRILQAPEIVSSNKPVLYPIETTLMEELSTVDRIFSFSNRTVFNVDTFSLLVLNMPVNDEKKYGRYKDHFSFIAQSVESKIQNILLRNSELSKTHKIIELIRDINSIISPLETIQVSCRDIFDSLMFDFDDAFLRLGLTEAQEQQLLDLLKSTELKTTHLLEDVESVVSKIREIASS